jgi:hypothetical protein
LTSDPIERLQARVVIMIVQPLPGRLRAIRFALAAALWFAFAAAAWAGIDEGVAAYDEGDYTTAMAELRPLADAGDARAQFYLGEIYEGGLGVAQNDAKALEWYRRAAEQGLAKAQYHLGLLYEIGGNVPRDYATAAAWHRRAAEQDYSPAQSSLARLYLSGLGTEPDLVQAHVWSNLAVLSGIQSAERYRAKAAMQMTRDELDMATTLAAEWEQKFGQ